MYTRLLLLMLTVGSLSIQAESTQRYESPGEVGVNGLQESATLKNFFGNSEQKKNYVRGYECRTATNFLEKSELSLSYGGRRLLSESINPKEVHPRSVSICRTAGSLANYKNAALDISYPGFQDLAIRIQKRRKKYAKIYFKKMSCHRSETEEMKVRFEVSNKVFEYFHDLGESGEELAERLGEFDEKCSALAEFFNQRPGNKALWVYFPGFGEGEVKTNHFIIKTSQGYLSSRDEEELESLTQSK